MFEESVPRWLHQVELTPGSARQTAIIDAANSLDSEIGPVKCMGLVLLAHSVEDREAFALVQETIIERDDTFGCAIKDLESRLIAAIFTAALLERGDDVAVLAAHSVLSAEWSGLVSVLPDLPALAARALFDRSESLRTRSGFAITTDLTGAAKAVPVFPADDGVTTHNEAAAMSAALAKAMETIKRSFEQASQRMNARLASSDEELDVLWWAFGEYSDIENMRWADAKGVRIPIVMAIELGRMTRFVVEPPSARAVLSRLLGPQAAEETSVAGAIEDTVANDIDVPQVARHQLIPLLSSINECSDFDGKPAWVDSVARSGITVASGMSGLDVAVQILREIMMAKMLSSE
jgi:hypothetical protein